MSKFFDYFPPPRFLEMPYIGLNITPSAVRFIEIIKGKAGFEVGSYGEKKFKETTELLPALEELRDKNKIKFVKASLPDDKAYVFNLEVPDASEAEIHAFIEFHLEENIPLALEETIFDYHLINPKNAIVSALPKIVASEYVEILQKANLIPTSFLIDSQAIAKAVVKDGDAGTYLIVHIDYTRTEFSVVSEQYVQFNSTLPVGAENFTAAVSKQFNLSEEEARTMKKEKGFLKSKDNTDLFFALISTASVIKDEIERIYSYWHTHTDRGQVVNREKIKKILLVGKDAAILGFKEYLTESVRTEIDIANVWVNTLNYDEYIPPIEASDALNFATAIGLALPK